MLLRAQAKPELVDNDGQTPLQVGADHADTVVSSDAKVLTPCSRCICNGCVLPSAAVSSNTCSSQTWPAEHLRMTECLEQMRLVSALAGC